jgi:predicted DsbA family dithiol-disulfide isomerase
MAKLRIDVWSDIVCPFCYIGKARFERALAAWPHAAEVELVWRSFELDPKAPAIVDTKLSHVERIAAKYGMPVAEMQKRTDSIVASAKEEGLDLHFEQSKSGNTFDAHRLLHLALEHGAGTQNQLKDRLMRGYFTDGRAIGDRDELVSLAADVGIPAEEARAVLASDKFAEDVRRDERLAREFGVNGVPFFLLGGLVGMSGAQPLDIMRSALDRAWAELEDAAPESHS